MSNIVKRWVMTSFLDDRSYMLFRGDVTDGVIVRLVEEGAEEVTFCT